MKIFSATWHSGRYDSTVSSGVKPISSLNARDTSSTLRLDRSAPLGGPVVPEV